MTRLLGILMIVALLYASLMGLDEHARSLENQQTIGELLGFYGVLTVGVGVLIIAGGIDLSIGSVVGLGAVCFGLLLKKQVPPVPAAALVVTGGAVIGLVHGLLVTQLRLQSFLVTLCGLFIYRGLARWASSGSVGLADRSSSPEFQQSVKALRDLVMGYTLGVPNLLGLLVSITGVLTLFLHGTRYGRYLFALGANEEAARYAGIPTNRYKVLAYVICSTLAGLGGVLFLLHNESANPTSAGAWLELYAITGAVLGGCSLRGGEGSVPGMFLGAAVLPLLRKLCSFGDISDDLQPAVVGTALLLCTIIDELLKGRSPRR